MKRQAAIIDRRSQMPAAGSPRSVVVGNEVVGYQNGQPIYKQVQYPGSKH